jgi:hypothetical protein
MKTLDHLKFVCLLACVLLFLNSCKKTQNGPPPPNTTGTFSFSGTEYTGTANAGNDYYPQPISIRFNKDSSMSTFTHLLLNGVYSLVKGKVTKVASNAQGGTDITVSYAFPATEAQFNGPQVYTISADKTTMTGGAFPLYAISGILKLFPAANAPSVVGHWATPNGYYPEVGMMSFGEDSTATYQRYDGKILTYPGDATQVIHIKFSQNGGRVIFSGINAAQNYLIVPFYGVLTADGKSMFLDSYDFVNAELPYPSSTGTGPVGVTPNMQRL